MTALESVAPARAASPGSGRAPATTRPAFPTEIALALLVAVAAWVAFRSSTGATYEDALITYRYAANLASGHGLVYNVGERVLGTTTPLFTLLLAALGAAFGPARIPLLSNALGLLAFTGAGLLLGATLRRLRVPAPGAAAAVLVASVHPAVLWASTSGLETPLVLFFMALSLHAFVNDRPVRTASACALLVLTRVDGIVWALPLAVAVVTVQRRAAWRPLLVAFAIAAPWFAFAWIHFGSPLPHSLLAKLEIRPHLGRVDYLGWFASACAFGRPMRAITPEITAWGTLVLAGVVGVLARPRLRSLWPIVLHPLAFMAFLVAGHAPRMPWYVTTIGWCVAVLAAVGLIEAFRVASGLAAGARRAVAFVLVATLAAFAGFGLVQRDLQLAELTRLEQRNEDGLRRRAGEWIAANTPRSASVAMEAIGYQGTFARRRIIDLAGLISPEVVAIHRRSRSNADAMDHVLQELHPDVLLLRSFEVDENRHAHGGPLFETPEQRARFFAHYAEAQRLVAPVPALWGENSFLTIWRRVR